MSSLLPKFVSRVDFKSYEDFKENLKILPPEDFNFAYDIVDAYAAESPDKRALVWCNDHGEEKIITFGELKVLSDKAANMFTKYGLRKGDTVMLTLKSRWEFWVCMVGLNKVGAISIPSTHMLKAKDFVYRIKKADLKMIICIGENGVPGEFDAAHKELGAIPLVKALVGSPEQKREGWINFNAELEEASADFVRPSGEQATRNEDILLGYFTSGTTGYPKMVKHD
ncbi:MAG TPA: AMP-binding protein, partial [Methanothrix sp.]|nr:AMP-binding protein [Methanothrix sp.]